MSRSDKPMLPDRGDGVTRRDFLHDLAVAGLLAAAPNSIAAAVGEASAATAASVNAARRRIGATPGLGRHAVGALASTRAG